MYILYKTSTIAARFALFSAGVPHGAGNDWLGWTRDLFVLYTHTRCYCAAAAVTAPTKVSIWSAASCAPKAASSVRQHICMSVCVCVCISI